MCNLQNICLSQSRGRLCESSGIQYLCYCRSFAWGVAEGKSDSELNAGSWKLLCSHYWLNLVNGGYSAHPAEVDGTLLKIHFKS